MDNGDNHTNHHPLGQERAGEPIVIGTLDASVRSILSILAWKGGFEEDQIVFQHDFPLHPPRHVVTLLITEKPWFDFWPVMKLLSQVNLGSWAFAICARSEGAPLTHTVLKVEQWLAEPGFKREASAAMFIAVDRPNVWALRQFLRERQVLGEIFVRNLFVAETASVDRIQEVQIVVDEAEKFARAKGYNLKQVLVDTADYPNAFAMTAALVHHWWWGVAPEVAMPKKSSR